MKKLLWCCTAQKSASSISDNHQCQHIIRNPPQLPYQTQLVTELYTRERKRCTAMKFGIVKRPWCFPCTNLNYCRKQRAVKVKSFPGKIVSSSMSGSLKVPSKLGKRKDEDENKRLALKVKIGKQKVFFF